MKKSIDQDLVDASDSIEHLLKQYDKLTIEEKVDVAARLKAILKNGEALSDKIKDEIKDRLKHKAGTVLGEIFKAVLKIVPCDRLDQKRLKEEKPAVHAQFVRHDEDERVGFEAR